MASFLNKEDLSASIAKGQVKEFTDFYNLFFKRLLLESDKYVQDIFIAEEIVQDIFVRIWEQPAILEEAVSIKSYLYKSVINASINFLNRQKNIRKHHEVIMGDLSEADIETLDDENEMVTVLYAEIEKLPPQCKKVFKMSRFDRLKYREIAVQLDISEKTVENHVSTALKTLRKVLLEKYPDRSSKNTLRKIISIYL